MPMNLFMCGAHQTRFNTTTINGHMTHTFLCDINIMSSPSKVHKTNKINIILYAAFIFARNERTLFRNTQRNGNFFFRKLTQKIKYTTKKKFSLMEIIFFLNFISKHFFSLIFIGNPRIESPLHH